MASGHLMGDRNAVFIHVVKASLMTIFLLATAIAIVSIVPQNLELSPRVEGIGLIALMCLLFGLPPWWLFRKLRTHGTTRELRAIAFAFTFCNPVSLCVTVLLAEISGGVGEALGRGAFKGPLTLLFAFGTIALLPPVLNSAACWLAVWLERRTNQLVA